MKKHIIRIRSIMSLCRLAEHGWHTLSATIGNHHGVWHMGRGNRRLIVTL